jgi:hypothetical protein
VSCSILRVRPDGVKLVGPGRGIDEAQPGRHSV